MIFKIIVLSYYTALCCHQSCSGKHMHKFTYCNSMLTLNVIDTITVYWKSFATSEWQVPNTVCLQQKAGSSHIYNFTTHSWQSMVQICTQQIAYCICNIFALAPHILTVLIITDNQYSVTRKCGDCRRLSFFFCSYFLVLYSMKPTQTLTFQCHSYIMHGISSLLTCVSLQEF